MTLRAWTSYEISDILICILNVVRFWVKYWHIHLVSYVPLPLSQNGRFTNQSRIALKDSLP